MIKRGDIYYISRDYTEIGREERAGRPGVVISCDELNEEGFGAVVAFMTSSPNNNSPYHCEVDSFNSRTSIVLCETVRYVSAKRLGDLCGRLSAHDMQKVEYCLNLVLDLNLYSEVEQAEDEESTQNISAQEISTQNILAENARLNSELKIYKQLYSELLDRCMKGGANG